MNPVFYEQIMSILGLIGLWAFWYYLWKPQRVDAFRQQLFALRTELFDLGSNGVVSFSDPGYTQLRLMINGMIRFAHRVSFPSLIVAIALAKRAPSSPLAEWEKKVQRLPEESSKQLLAIRDRVSLAIGWHLASGPILLCLLVCALALFALLRALFMLLTGKRDFHNLTVEGAYHRMAEVTKNGTNVIEARVLYEEQRRADMRPHHAYAN